MKYAVCFILIWLCSLSAKGQQSYLDSLLTQLDHHLAEDTIRLKLLNEIAYTFSGIDPERGLKAARDAIKLAETLEHYAALPVAYNYLGVNYRAMGQDSLALEAMEESLRLYQKQGNKLGIGRMLNNLGLIYYNLSDYSTALQYHEEASAIFEEVDYPYGLLHTYNNVGVVHLAWSDYPRALEAFLHAQRLVTEDDSLMLGNILSNIGLVYKNLQDYDPALRYQQEALDLYEKIGNLSGAARALGNLATLYDLTGKPERAIDYYLQALTMNEKLGDNRRIASDYTNLGVVNLGMSDYAAAIDYLAKGLTYYRRTNDKANTALALLELSQAIKAAPVSVLQKKGYNPTRLVETMLDLQLSALKLAEESGSLRQQQQAWHALSLTYELSNRIPDAYAAFKKHVIFKDSIYNETNRRELIQKQAQFDYEKKEALLTAAFEQEKALAEMELQRQKSLRNFTAAGLIFFLLATVGGVFLYKKKRDAEERQKESEFDAMVAEVEMKALRAQMNPHFIFNSLNSISHFILTRNLQEADYYLSKFAKLMRQILENSEYKEVPLADDLQVLQTYMDLEAARMDKKFSYTIQIDPEIDPDNVLVPPLLLQPFVENSIWHGFQALHGQGKIEISVNKEADNIHISIEDNGVGRKQVVASVLNGKRQARASMGVKITQERLNILSKLKNAEAKMELIDLQQGLRVDLKLPLIFNF